MAVQEKVKGVLEGIKQRWSAIKKRTKILMGVGLLVVIAAIVVVVLISSNQPYTVLFTGLNQSEMTEITSYLSESGVTDYQIQGSDTILVPQNQEPRLKAALVQQGYPSQGFAYSTYLDNVGSLTTEAERNTLFLFELQDRIAATVRCFDGVRDATVNIVQGEDNTYVLDSNNLVTATATVTVTMEEGRMLTDGQVEGIRNLVSHSVKGLTIENVVIQDTVGNNYTMTDTLGEVQDASSLKLKLEQQVNNYIRTQVSQQLSPLFGPDNFQVSVYSTVDVDRTYTDSTDYSLEDWADDGSTDGRGIIGTEIYNGEIIRGDEETVGGVVGTGTNADLNTYVEEQVQPNGDETYLGTSGEKDYLTDTTKTQVERVSGRVSDVMVAVTINSAVAGQVEADDLYPQIARASGIGADLQRDKISVLISPFYEEPVTPAPVVEGLPDWVLYAAIGGAALFLVLLILILIIARARKKRRQRLAAAQAAALAEQVQAAVQVEPTGADIMEMQTEKSMELRKEVRKFAEENPEIAAQMVKNWLREGDGAQ